MPRIYTRRPTELPGLLVDDEDRWRIEDRRWIINQRGYVATLLQVGLPKPKYVVLHRVIMNAPPGTIVDHINGNKLDNRKCNLRIVNQAINMQNQKKRKLGVSGYRGVHLVNGKWVARVRAFGKQYQRGPFATAKEASVAAEALRREHQPGYHGRDYAA